MPHDPALSIFLLKQIITLSLLTSYSLNASEQRELQSRMERKQMKEFMTVGLTACTEVLPNGDTDVRPCRQMYSKLVQRCFDDCVNDFTTKSLHSAEEGCVMRCVDKNLKASERLGTRFQEQNAAMSGQVPNR